MEHWLGSTNSLFKIIPRTGSNSRRIYECKLWRKEQECIIPYFIIIFKIARILRIKLELKWQKVKILNYPSPPLIYFGNKSDSIIIKVNNSKEKAMRYFAIKIFLIFFSLKAKSRMVPRKTAPIHQNQIIQKAYFF